MIYLFTALYCEASYIISRFHLKKNPENTRFQEFYSEAAGIRLTVTGVGEIAAAAAVSSVCTEHIPMPEDILLNIGTCARQAGGDGIFLCNKIVEQATGKSFYPDVLYRHGFVEEMIVTGMNVNNDAVDQTSLINLSGGMLYDMEAAAIYQAGAYFFGPHQMIFVKLVSDPGAAETVTKEQIEKLMKKYQDALYSFITQCLDIIAEHAAVRIHPDPVQEKTVERLCTDMHCSKVMRDSLRQHIHYFRLSGADVAAVIESMYKEGLLPCKDKREGKIRYEEFKRRLL